MSRLPGDAMMMVSGVAAAGAVDTKFFTLDPAKYDPIDDGMLAELAELGFLE